MSRVPMTVKGAELLQVLVLGQFVNAATGSVGFLLAMTGNERSMRKAMLIAGILAIFMSFLLVPLYGVMGAAISTALAVAFQNLLAAWYVSKRLRFNIFWSTRN